MTGIELPTIIIAIFFVCLNIYLIKSLKIPILSIIVGIITVAVAFLMQDMMYFPYVNMLIAVFGVYCILSSVVSVRDL